MSYKLLITKDEYDFFLNEVRNKLLMKYSYQELDCKQCVIEHPTNDCYADVEAKVKLLNTYYSTRVIVKPMVENILKIAAHVEFQNQLESGNPKLVSKIANSSRDNFSFATKYCALLVPDKYPIYDNLVWKFFCKLNDLGFFDKTTNEKFRNIKKHHSEAYSDYLDIYREFLEKSGINKYAKSYREVDAFLWGAIKTYLLLDKDSNHTKIKPARVWLDKHLPDIVKGVIASAIWDIISQIKF